MLREQTPPPTPERFIRDNAAAMCDYRLSPQERVHRLITGKIELSVADWQQLVAKVFAIDPARAWEVIENAKKQNMMAHELLFAMRNGLPITDHGFDGSVMKQIDDVILAHFKPEPFRPAGPVTRDVGKILGFGI